MSARGAQFYQALVAEKQPERLQAEFLRLLLETQGLGRGSIWVQTPEGYRCLEAAGEESDQVRGVLLPRQADSIVGWVIANGRRTTARVGEDRRHYAEAERGLAVKSSRILCFPLIMDRDRRGGTGEVYGALELIVTEADGRSYTPDAEYLDLLEELVGLGAAALSAALDFADQAQENARLKAALDALRRQGPLLGASPAFRAAVDRAGEYARTDFPVLITGESGTGKELMALEIHRRSRRADKPFLVQNCSAIPDTLLESELFGYRKGAFTGASRDRTGLFEAAHGGTVFLDEIGDMPLNLQARILRIIEYGEVKPLGSSETRTVDVRIISATNQDLERCIRENTFREDLYYRLNVLPLRLPPLRSRREDIGLLMDYFLKREALRMEREPLALSREAMALVRGAPWEGNVRELQNLAKFLVATVPGGVVEPERLPAHVRAGTGLAGLADMADEAVEEFVEKDQDQADAATAPDPAEPDLSAFTWEELERRYVLDLLERHTWNVTKAARQADVNRSTFDSRMKKLGIRKR